MTSPIGIVSIISVAVLTVEFGIMRVMRSLLGTSLRFTIAGVVWDLTDSLIMTATVIPVLYLLVSKMRDQDQRTQKIILESEKRYRSVVEQSVVGVSMIQDARFVYANQALADLLGFTSGTELIGVEIMALVADRDRDAMSKIGRQRADGATEQLQYNCALMRTDGTVVELEVNSVVTLQEDVPTTIAVLHDITAKLRAEEAAARYLVQQEAAFMSAVQIATNLTELRDPYTQGHASRVGQIAAAIGAELGFDEKSQRGLQVAGNLHDIGKIGIPLNVLCTQDKLTEQEWGLIHRHPQTGYDILRGIYLPWPVAEVVLQHHERMDGSGYPQGLCADAIILEARIVMVADVVESMSHSRPYRPGMGITRALAEIERGSGTVYDTVVATACLRMFRENGFAISQ